MNTRKFGRKQLDKGANCQKGNEADFQFRALAFRKTTTSLETNLSSKMNIADYQAFRFCRNS